MRRLEHRHPRPFTRTMDMVTARDFFEIGYIGSAHNVVECLTKHPTTLCLDWMLAGAAKGGRVATARLAMRTIRCLLAGAPVPLAAVLTGIDWKYVYYNMKQYHSPNAAIAQWICRETLPYTKRAGVRCNDAPIDVYYRADRYLAQSGRRRSLRQRLQTATLETVNVGDTLQNDVVESLLRSTPASQVDGPALLYRTITAANASLVNILIEHGMVNGRHRYPGGVTPLMLAVERQSTTLAHTLVAVCGTNVEDVDDDGFNAMDRAAASHYNYNMISVLAEYGAVRRYTAYRDLETGRLVRRK